MQPRHRINVAQSDAEEITKKYIARFRSNDRTRGWTMDVLQDDWPCSVLIMARVIRFLDKSVDDEERKRHIFRRIVESAIDRYEITIIPKYKTGHVPMSYNDMFRLSVFIEALLTAMCSNLKVEEENNGCGFKVKGSGKTHSKNIFGLRKRIYQAIVPEAMRNVLIEEYYEECIVAGFIDFCS